jgi:beta-aspartyl-peptidase (threonine type)
MSAIAIHGGAGLWRRDGEEEVHAVLREALVAGGSVLERGGKALDAVQGAVEVLEDAPKFNAGRGAVSTADGSVELDACVMDGVGRRAGAIACVRNVRHPVALARAVLDHSPHVLLVARGAEEFADEQGLERVDDAWFQDVMGLAGGDPVPPEQVAVLRRRPAEETPIEEAETVGAVAIDVGGHVAAATSTGGMKGQRPGRVGDAPVPGAGTYAEDGVCAVSGTGDGEAFMTAVAAQVVAVLVRHGRLSIAEASSLVLRSRITGTGGMIVVNPRGEIAMPFTTPAMARGLLRIGEEPWTAIGPDEES